jgi:gag-polypeptide of LTR copia-type/Zinc knuckle
LGVVNGSVAQPAITDLEELADWNAKSTDGYTAIGLALMPDQAIHIHDCVDAPLAWNALEHVYLRNSAANQISLKHHLYSTRHDLKDSIHSYINNITTLTSQLHAMGMTMGEEDITDVLIFNLPTAYNSVATTLMTQHGRLTVSDVSAALIKYESCNKSDSDSNVSDSAHITQSSSCVKGKPTKDLNGVTCHHCQKLGHYAHDCTAAAPIQSEEANFEVNAW